MARKLDHAVGKPLGEGAYSLSIADWDCGAPCADGWANVEITYQPSHRRQHDLEQWPALPQLSLDDELLPPKS